MFMMSLDRRVMEVLLSFIMKGYGRELEVGEA